jgi:hypothetical protein
LAETELGTNPCAIGYARASVDETKIDVGHSRAGKNKIIFAVRGGPTQCRFDLGAIVAKPI